MEDRYKDLANAKLADAYFTSTEGKGISNEEADRLAQICSEEIRNNKRKLATKTIVIGVVVVISLLLLGLIIHFPW